MSAVGLADALVAAPRGQATAARPGREAGTRFAEVLTAAGVDVIAETVPRSDDASTQGVDGLRAAHGDDASSLLAATSLALMPTIAGSESAAAADAVAAETGTEGASAGETGGAEPGTADPGTAEAGPLIPSTAGTTLPVHGMSVPVPPVALTDSPATPVDGEAEPSAERGLLHEPTARATVATSASMVSPTGAPAVLVAGGAPGVSVQPDLADGATVSTDGVPAPAATAGAAASASASRASSAPVVSLPMASAAVASPAPTSTASAGAASPAEDGVPASAPPTPAIAAAVPATPTVTAAPVDAATPASPVSRAVAAQVSPVVVSIAQRPSGVHQLTMTVNPDSLGPVTIRAHIGQGGDVRVELFGATDAGRDALRAIVTDLRRDLAGAMPHATLSIAQGTGADAGAERGGQTSAGGAGEQGSTGRDSGRDAHGAPVAADTRDHAPQSPATTIASIPGSGLDILA
ncbi:flagellar hook-length control protein FliK [Microbacterium sp. GCS4]|uniref:flagellar hook-length control protein FliK n=1 Tax=Microbacterium sp. GCS4 TaxID=1692239 RepID=UPI0006834E8F|nr:flagellar hook-length control protein FliK [Microbacterium sp. GCS4]KNY06888.1 hypothetical protein AKH00_00700 [Microbacterium sp. GCS4]